MSIACHEMFLMLCQKCTQSPGEPCTPKPDLFPWQDLPLLLLVLRISLRYISVALLYCGSFATLMKHGAHGDSLHSGGFDQRSDYWMPLWWTVASLFIFILGNSTEPEQCLKYRSRLKLTPDLKLRSCNSDKRRVLPSDWLLLQDVRPYLPRLAGT